MIFTINFEHPLFSYLINKHPDNVYEEKLNQHFNLEGKFIFKDDFYQVKTIPNKDNFIKYAKDKNLSCYLLNEPYMVSPMNLEFLFQMFKNTMNGKFDVEYDNVPRFFEVNVGPILVDNSIDIVRLFQDYFRKVEISAHITFIGDSYNVFELSLCGKERIDLLFQKLYIILLAYTMRSVKSDFIPNNDKLKKYIKMMDEWIYESDFNIFIMSRLGKNKYGKEFLKHGEVNKDEMRKIFFDSQGNQRYQKICSLLNEHSNVLELGCSSGNLVSWLKRTKTKINSYQGIDSRSFAIQKAKEKNKRQKRYRFDEGNILYLDKYYFDKCDTIILSEVIEHFEEDDRIKIINFLCENCHDKRIIISVPNIEVNDTYWNINGLRHFDHKVEYTRELFESEIVKRFHEYTYNIERICISDDMFYFDDQISFIIDVKGMNYVN